MDDFGNEEFREPLRVLLDAYRAEQGLPFLRRAFLREDVLWSLGQRLEVVKLLGEHPEIADSPIYRPVFITGFPRTGTTALHQLLALDPSKRWLRLQDLVSCVPWPDKRGRDKRPVLADRYARYLDWAFPELRVVHPLDTFRPVEDYELTRRSFISPAYGFDAELPGYRVWFAEQPLEVRADAYRFHRIQLQILQRGLPPGGRWLHKSPTHLGQLDALLEVYPDARIILMNRDPVKVVPSFCSLLAIIRSRSGVRIDHAGLGASVTEMLAEAQEAARAVRSRCDPSQFCDVAHADLVRSPLDTVRRVYDHFGDTMSAEVESRVRQWVNDHPRSVTGSHRYSLEQFGLDAEVLRRRLS